MSDSAPPPWPVCAVVFDLDGLMIDSEPIFEEVAVRLLRRLGRELDRGVMQAMMGTPARQSLELLRDHYGLTETIDQLGEECRVLFFEVAGTEPVPLMPGLLDLLDRLERKGLPKAIATSSSAEYVEIILLPHDLRRRFAFVLTCDDVVRGKPCPEVYEKAAERFGCPPAEMLVLEDSVNGLRAAKAAGARCVVVPHERVPGNALGEANLVVPSLADRRLFAILGLEP